MGVEKRRSTLSVLFYIKRQKLLMSLTDEESTTTFNQVIFTNDPEQERQCRLDVRFKIYNEQ